MEEQIETYTVKDYENIFSATKYYTSAHRVVLNKTHYN